MQTKNKRLELIRTEELGDCRRCGLCETRNSIVFGRGDGHTPLMFIGEGPGEEEDRQGLPFVGPAGELLYKLIRAMGWPPELVYIANVVKCRPPANRAPDEAERQACWPFLERQIEVVSPQVIVTLGNVATRALFPDARGIMSIRGQWHRWRNFDVMPTYHPAFVLRQPTGKNGLWADAKAVMKRLADRAATDPWANFA